MIGSDRAIGPGRMRALPPCDSNDTEDETAAGPNRKQNTGPHRPSVLLVDDDVDFLFSMRVQLAAATSDVFIAQTPQAALGILERHAIDAVVCDLVLGDTDGRHVLQLVREQWPRVARILVTGYGERLSYTAEFPSAQAMILKPCDASALAELLGKLTTSIPGVVRVKEVRLMDRGTDELVQPRASRDHADDVSWDEDTEPGE